MSIQPKVLLLTSELFPEFGYPTAGGGVRAQQLFRMFEQAGCEIILGLWENSARDRHLPEWATQNLYQFQHLDNLIERIDPDWVVGEGWEPLSHLRIRDQRLYIADCPGPLVLESCLSRPGSLRSMVFYKVRTLNRVDAILCPNLPMRHYLGSYMTLAGWQPSDTDRLFQLPIGLPDQLPARQTRTEPNLSIFVGGITWAWHKTSTWLPILADELAHRQIGHLVLRMGHHPHHHLEESVFEPLDQRLQSHPAVTVLDLAAWDELISDLSQTHLAIEWGQRNLEREIASTLRVVTYLWSGVPVIIRPHMDLASEIEAFEAGWVVDRWEDLIELLSHLSRNPGEIEHRSRGAQRLARERHTYSTLSRSFPGSLFDLTMRVKEPSYLDHTADLLKAQEDAIRSQEHAIHSLNEVIHSRDDMISSRDRALGDLHRELENLHRELQDQQHTLTHLRHTITGRDTAIHFLEREIGYVNQQLEAANSERGRLIEQVRIDNHDAESYRAIRRKLIYRIWKRIVG